MTLTPLTNKYYLFISKSNTSRKFTRIFKDINASEKKYTALQTLQYVYTGNRFITYSCTDLSRRNTIWNVHQIDGILQELRSISRKVYPNQHTIRYYQRLIQDKRIRRKKKNEKPDSKTEIYDRTYEMLFRLPGTYKQMKQSELSDMPLEIKRRFFKKLLFIPSPTSRE